VENNYPLISVISQSGLFAPCFFRKKKARGGQFADCKRHINSPRQNLSRRSGRILPVSSDDAVYPIIHIKRDNRYNPLTRDYAAAELNISIRSFLAFTSIEFYFSYSAFSGIAEIPTSLISFSAYGGADFSFRASPDFLGDLAINKKE